MSEEPYLNGRGIMAATHRLNDIAWSHLPKAFIGVYPLAIAAISLTLVLVGVARPWALVITALASVAAVALIRPWWRAMAVLKVHTVRLNAETAKRGKGWAKS